MIQVRNKIIPFGGYKAMTVWPFIFIKKNANITDKLINHEEIHGRQQLEMLLIFFYLWYGIEWLIKFLFKYRNYNTASKNISFEREAYENDDNLSYLEDRKLYSWFKYI